MKRHYFAGVTASLLASALLALAQQAPNPVEAAAQTKATEVTTAELFKPSTERTGQDLILLQEHKPFYVRLDQRVSWTDNAFFTGNKQDDVSYFAGVAAGFDTLTESGVDLKLEGSFSGIRYHRFSQLDYNYYGGTAGIGYRAGGFRIGVDYQPLQFMDRDFANDLVLYHDFGLSLGYQGAFSPQCGYFIGVRGSRVFGYPNEYDSWRIAPNLGVYYQPRYWFSAVAGVSGSHTSYDNYFQALTGQDRADRLVSGILSFNFTPKRWLNFGVLVQYADNDSSLNVSDYKAFSVTPNATLRFRF